MKQNICVEIMANKLLRTLCHPSYLRLTVIVVKTNAHAAEPFQFKSKRSVKTLRSLKGKR